MDLGAFPLTNINNTVIKNLTQKNVSLLPQQNK